MGKSPPCVRHLSVRHLAARHQQRRNRLRVASARAASRDKYARRSGLGPELGKRRANKRRTFASQWAKALCGPSHAGALLCQFRREEFLPIGLVVAKTPAKSRKFAILPQGVVS